MFPKLFTIDTPEFLQGILPEHISIYSYGFFIALGMILSFLYARRQVKKFGIDSDELSSLYIWGILASFVGGKLFYWFEDIDKYIENPALMLKIAGGGFVFYGSLLFAIPTIFLWLKKKKVPVRPFFDIIAFVGPIIHAVGRIGCFMAGCCHGKVCHNFLGVTYTHPESMADPMNTPLYPTQLFDIVINVIILITLSIVAKKKKFEGQLFLIYLMMYAVGRSINEIFRGDEERGFVLNGLLSHSQFIAIGVLIGSILLWRRWLKLDPSRI